MMDKRKNIWQKLIKVTEIGAISVVILAISSVLAIVVPIFMFVFLWEFGDYLRYPHNVYTREQIIQTYYDNSDEYDMLAAVLKEKLSESDKIIVSYDSKNEYKTNGIKSDLLKHYPIRSISGDYDDENFIADIAFVFAPKGYTYCGLYYSENGEPSGWGANVEWVLEGNLYIQYGSYYRYETEKIADQWYYYQCWCK